MFTRSTRRKMLLGLALLCLLVALWLGWSYAFARRVTRRARPAYYEPAPRLADVRPLRLTTDDGETLGAWSLPGRPDRPLFVLLHGNGADRSSCLDEAAMLADDGHPVLLVTLRAHGDSTGDVNDFGFSARHDVAAAVAWAERHDRPVVVWGRSLGSAAALFAAEHLGRRVAGYVLECPYRDLRTALWNRARMRLPRPAADVAYLGLLAVAPLVLADVDRISPLDAAATVPRGTPVLILAGGKDERARPDEARAIRDRIGGAAELVVVEDGGHLDLDPRRVREAVRRLAGQCRR